MGYYKWSRTLTYSGETVLLDGTDISACVKTPKSTVKSTEIGDIASEASTALVRTVLESHGKLQGVLDDSAERMLDASDRLQFIPSFGYFLVSGNPLDVETKNGDSVKAIVGFRAKSSRGQMTPFYLFESGNGALWTGKIGKYKVVCSTSDSDDDKVAMHFEITCYL